MSSELEDLQTRTFARATRATVAAYPKDRRLTGAQLATYLDRRTFAVISSTRKDGRPHAALGWYGRVGSTFWLPTVGGSVRERNVRHHPWLALSIAEGDTRHIVVLVEGPAGVVPPESVPPEVYRHVKGDWASTWLRMDASHLLSYASEDADI